MPHDPCAKAAQAFGKNPGHRIGQKDNGLRPERLCTRGNRQPVVARACSYIGAARGLSVFGIAGNDIGGPQRLEAAHIHPRTLVLDMQMADTGQRSQRR